MIWLTCMLVSALTVAPRDVAITVAITKEDRVLVIVANREDGVVGVDITDDVPIPDVFAAADWARSHELDVTERPTVTLAHTALRPGAGNGAHHIAAAVNYVDHARETSMVPGDVFVFPKIGQAAGADATVGTVTGELLDYEVELCARFDRTVGTRADMRDARVALFLCHDWSERAVVIREFDEKQPRKASGFTRGKSHPDYYQASPIVVVPHAWQAFARSIELELRVDGEVRQRGHTRDMIAAIDELVGLALDCGTARDYLSWTGPAAVLPDGVITPDMTLLTGTPSGVAFAPPSTWFRVANALEYFVIGVFGPFYRMSPRQYVREEYVDALVADRVFLQPGQVVVSSGTYLGRLTARIINR